ncbi:related to sterigmatocystin 7-O-methyltransferase precursor [Phialocephala subalpina]|uniref:Related to sterigmatocystin 7-O-methyltransferase n=1 Tax=Phialocephala subalpina TaxID=576137 RepID=A0A1L7XXR3_9HELO|nr:related to sterigmatocystin 7-O-methyltransferase precursor [Phialocephala subalpina]
MSSLKRITTLSDEISKNSKILTDYLAEKGLEAASFDVDGLAEWPIAPSDEVAFKARLNLIAATKELHDLSLGPKEGLRYLAWDSVNQLSLQAMYEFKIYEAVPLSGSISYQDLADKVNVPMLNLRRLIRHAMTNRIFHEPRKGFVAHTRTSRLLLEDQPLNNWVGFMTNDLWLPIAHVVQAMKKWPGSGESNETSVNLAYGTDVNWFDWIQQDKGFANRYNLAMQAHGGGEGFAVSHTVDGYPWAELGDATVVDMGGNRGYVSFAVAEKFPNLKFIVQDTAGMRTASTIGTVPEHLTDRVSLTTHDFFTPQTVHAQVYFFRWIFHGFSEKYCIKILQALIPALKKGARIVINDGTLPEPGAAGYVEEKSMRTMDLFMQVTVNAREREVDDWAELFKQADKRFKFLKAWKPEKSRMWFIEAEWSG